MNRLEKSLYEKIINSAVLGRNRVLQAPKKWNYYDNNTYFYYFKYFQYKDSIYRQLMTPFSDLYNKYLVYLWQKDLCLQRGYTFDDVIIHSERQLRRSPFMEHIFRESTHPYYWLMFKARRRRYYKVERIINGFYVPEHLRQDVKNHTYVQSLQAQKEWQDFMYYNYTSDMTPTSAHGKGGKVHPLELFNLYGIWVKEAWSRYFFNEKCYDLPEDMEEFYEPFEKLPDYDVNTDTGKRQIEAAVNKFIADYPGYLIPEGEEFPFEEFFDSIGSDNRIKKQIVYSSKQLEDAKKRLEVELNEEKVHGKSTLGTEPNELIKPKQRKAFMN